MLKAYQAVRRKSSYPNYSSIIFIRLIMQRERFLICSFYKKFTIFQSWLKQHYIESFLNHKPKSFSLSCTISDVIIFCSAAKLVHQSIPTDSTKTISSLQGTVKAQPPSERYSKIKLSLIYKSNTSPLFSILHKISTSWATKNKGLQNFARTGYSNPCVS